MLDGVDRTSGAPAADGEAAAVAAVGRIEAVPAILDTICRLTGMGFAAVARVTEDRWIACATLDRIAFGLEPGGELDIDSRLCAEIRRHGDPVFIPDVRADATYCRHHTPARYGFRAYASYPILLRDGRFFGTLCAIDPEPADLGRPEIATLFAMFAELIAFHLAALDRAETAESGLRAEKAASGEREQFIAILGHDLRNPLASVQAGVRLLAKDPPREKAHQLIEAMQSSIDRMGALIDDVLDFARGRLGGGLRLSAGSHELGPIVAQVVAELVSSHPERDVTTHIALDHPVRCDVERISQLVSNLLGNALTHGARDRPVTIDCVTTGDALTLSVANGGEPIPADKLETIFQPFSRSEDGLPRDGLGLGLFIACEIARAHGGTLSVSSTVEETRFTFAMPLA